MSIQAKRYQQNPILAPNEEESWEAEATFNPSVVKNKKGYHLLYRAISNPQRYFGKDVELSSIGYAFSANGTDFIKRRQLITPEYKWEQFGCEDPRVTKLENKYYVFYTALDNYPHTAEGIKIGVAVTTDFSEIEAKYPVTHFNSKAGALFPEKIHHHWAMVLSVGTDQPPAKISLAFGRKETQLGGREFWAVWVANLSKYTLALPCGPQDQIEVGAPPLKTRAGWLLIYSHIENYFSQQPVFGLRAALLDSDNPLKVIGFTKQPLLVPKEEYEIYGKVPRIVFPSGAMIEGEKLNIYYGAADTTGCLAQLELEDLLKELLPTGKKRRITRAAEIKLKRFSGNPILKPREDYDWEAKYVFNPAAVYEDGRVHLVYRAMGEDLTSVFGYAASRDGRKIEERLSEPIYTPSWEFEKKVTLGFSGCEDPRLTKWGERFYICYTAYTGQDPTRIALSSIKVDDFLARRWQGWNQPRIISCPDRSDKNACLVEKKINGKYVFFHRIGGCIWIDFIDSLDFENEWLGGKILLCPSPHGWASAKVGIAGPPHQTKDGWLLIYHGLSKEDGKYRLGALLLDLENPDVIIGRLDYPLLEPEEDYEKNGYRPNTVFSCGSVVIGDELLVYYGAADQVIGLATVALDRLLKAFYRS